MKTSLVTNKLNTHIITTTKLKLLTLLMVLLSSWGWGQVANYSFSSSVGTYTAITGGTAHNTTSTDNANYSFTLPFTFTYNSVGYTVARPTTNGFLVLGANAPSTTNYTPLSNSSTSSNFAISAFGADLSSIVRSEVIGSSPNRVYVCQWSGAGRYSGGLQADNLNFQIRLYETTNAIEIVYGGNTATSSSSTVQVGLRGSVNTDYNNRTTTTNWSSTTSGTTNSSSVAFSSSINHTSGLTFTWSPPSPCSGTPTAGTIAANTSQNICSGSTPTALTVTGTSSGVTGITYQWEESTDNTTWTNATGGSGATSSSYTPPSFGGTTIYYRCKVTCTGSSLFDVTNTATIAPPANPTTQTSSLAFSSVSYTGFTASWTNGNGNRRVVYVSDAAITDPTNNSGAAAFTANTTYSGTGQQIVFDGTGTSVTVSGLTIGTTYNVKVIEYTRCGSTTFDNYFNLTSGTNSSTVTTSSASSVPWSEGFATTTLPANWTAASWSLNTTTAVNPALSSNYLYVNLDGSPSTANLTTPIIGSILSNYRFVVKYKLANYASPYASPASGSGNFIVAISTNNGTSYTDVETVANNALSGWQEYVLNLNAYAGQNIRIRLTGNYTSGDYYLAFDDFSVELTPTCYPATALASSAITYQTAAIGWTSPVTGTSPSGYEYEVRTSGAAGSGATGLVTSGTTTAPTASVSLTGLNGGTTYTYYVRSDCGGGDFSSWSSATFTTTSCNVPTAVTSSAITTTTATISWTAPATGSPSGYEYEIRTSGAAESGATGFVSTGTTTSPTVSANLTGLSASTTYSVYVRTNCYSGFNSSWTSLVTFNTLCDATTSFPASETFATYLPTACWQEGDLGDLTAGPTTIGGSNTSDWIEDGFLNSGTTGAAKMNIDAASGSEWLLSPFYTIPATGYRVKYSVGATNWNGTTAVTNWEADDFVELLVATSNTNWTVLKTYNSSNVPSHLGQVDNVDLSAYSGQTIRFAFRAFEGTSNGSADIDFFIDNFVIETIPTFSWTGATSTAWNTTTNWNPATVPTSIDNVIIPTTGITNFPVATSLTIASGSTMTLNSNAQLTINGTLTNNGTLTLESGATLVQGTGNTVAGSGTFNVKQALTGAGGSTPSGRFWYLGSPVSGATSTVFNAAGDNRLWTFAEATQSYTEITTNGVSMSPMQGHVARLGANETSIFTGGLLNTGNYTNSSLTNTGTGSTRGYTLLSNPYPSYLDWTAAYTAAVATNVNLSSSIWYRSNDGTNMVYDIYNATGAIATNNSGGTTTQYIPPMQAFWVYNPNDGTTGSVTFSNSMRSHQNNGGLKSITDFPAFVRLNLENDGAIDQTVLYFDNNAATGYDNFDSDKMMVSNAAQVYSFVDNKKLAINGMKSVKTNKQVPLTVEFPTTKSYSFNATEVAMTDGIVILEDRLMNVFQDLTMNPVYAFDAVAGTDANRFVVHFQVNSGVAGIETAEDNGIDIVSNASGLVTITLSEELPAMGTIQIIDINGKVIATQVINEQTTTMNIHAVTGVYHVLVDSASKVARKKIVITK